jgi:hypothetical protein
MKNQVEELTADDIGNKGQEIYDRLIRPSLETENLGRIIAIDIYSEDYEIGEDPSAVMSCLERRRPGAMLFVMRIGGGGVYRIGFIP